MKLLRLATLGVALCAAVAAGCSQSSTSSSSLPFASTSAQAPNVAHALSDAAPQGRPVIYSSHGHVIFADGAFPALRAAIEPHSENLSFFVEVGGIQGSSTTSGFTKWIPVTDFTVTPEATDEVLQFSQDYNDISTPSLLNVLYSGHAIKGNTPDGKPGVAELAVAEQVGSTLKPIMTFEFGATPSPAAPVYVTSDAASWTAGAAVVIENVTLASQAATFCVANNNVEGEPGTMVCEDVGPTPTPSPTPRPTATPSPTPQPSATPTPFPSPKFTEFPIPSSQSAPYNIAMGYDGALWFTENGANNVGRITSAGAITEYPARTGHAGPNGITQGPATAGDEWFSESAGNQIGRISTAGVVESEYPIPTTLSNPSGITLGPDGNVWFVEGNGNKVASVSTAGVVNEYPIPTSSSSPIGITAGPDGNLWFTEGATGKIANVTTQGVITEFPLASGSGPSGIVAGPDGALWFAESGTGKIGRMTTAGSLTNEFSLPASPSPIAIANGYDGALWFTDGGTNSIGRITTAGVVTEYPIPTASSLPFSIVEGPNSSMWFVERNGNKIGEFGPIAQDPALRKRRLKHR